MLTREGVDPNAANTWDAVIRNKRRALITKAEKKNTSAKISKYKVTHKQNITIYKLSQITNQE